ncbi:HD domain-containing protein [Peteryoungia desertarenae]|uniref:HD domain-containing protein n=1 Tax=Peteryoungia desertarenae TaxID=1813451 RepID=A0ABX6QMZ7_9HYPH|nr:HD domain-containing protein [Peteryoungia desertarenae]QLF69951.1 HD domain-containing protein [Peteryoungia desertarenae]
MVTTLTADAFHPHETLAKSVLPHACEGDDGSHDLAHIHRVFRNAMRIHGQEGGDGEVVAAAVLLHDCVAVEKSSPLRKQASRLAAEKAAGVLGGLGWKASRIEQVAHAILTHSFSANLEPESIEARILQDADRLDAIGAIGIARCFYTAGRMGSALYHAGDPEAMNRDLNDRDYAIDHFPAKLLMLASGFKTKAGQALANARQERLDRFLSDFHDEI